MANTYNEEDQRPILQQLAAPAATETPAQTTAWDWVKKYRVWIIIGIIVLILLIWWFCIRKDGKASTSSNVSTTINVPAAPAGTSTTTVKAPETLKLTKIRGSNNMY